ncbi:putative dynein arm light chain, axonemal [Trypanosoma conorhini]|uniref:Putative dynein arm light chain, axonemal n=1 Tax=Trypanosoma conorhini TaxID=83891 RepID=A0A422QBM0_9TRYP|nr:putative dynein arm light chain, axonemal [Trypanosoma conorhini]RNF27380.1 putative dynein arm light chain, axonemal [Trypanosoma conorhini]
MSHAGSRGNVYDEKGTVLYRAVPENSSAVSGKSEEESTAAGGAAVDFSTTAPPNASAMNVTASVALRSRAPRISKSVSFTRPPVANAPAAATKKEAPKLIQNSLTPEQALLTLFPPEPLQDTENGSKKERKELGFSDAATSTICTAREPGERRWMKVAAIDHTSRLDCVHLQDHLERRCKEENARPSGVVCRIREEIYTDGLKELIRQTTVLCPERGLLLAELATEMWQTTKKYDILFDSACQYAVRKAIERDMRSYLFDDKMRLESEVRRLENRVNELRAKHDGMQERFEELKQAEQSRHEEEVQYLKKVNQQIVSEIKRITALEKAKATAAAQAQAQVQNTV